MSNLQGSLDDFGTGVAECKPKQDEPCYMCGHPSTINLFSTSWDTDDPAKLIPAATLKVCDLCFPLHMEKLNNANQD